MLTLDVLRRFTESAIIIFRALFRWFDLSAYIATKIVMPVQQVLFLSLLGLYAGGPSRVDYLVIGNGIVLAGLGGLWSAATLGEERAHGTLPLLLASPVNRLLNFLQRGVVHIADSLLTVSIALIFGVVLFHVDFSRTNFLALGVSIAVAVVSSIALGLLLGAFALAFAEVYFVANAVYYLLLLVAGVNVPVAALPVWLQYVSRIVPFTRSIAAARSAVQGATLGPLTSLLLTELALAGFYLLVGYLLLRLMEAVAVRHGNLESI